MLMTISLLIVSNIFMTFAWYGHLKNLQSSPLWVAILISWGIAFLEYCFQVPANRIGASHFNLGQLKIIQEVITLVVFVFYSTLYAGHKMTLNYLYAALCLIGAVYFIFSAKS